MIKIGCVSQKGGVGKSTLARDIAVQFAKNGFSVLLADLDSNQTTACKWNGLRRHAGHTPEITVAEHGDVNRLLGTQNFDVVVMDGKPHSSVETADIGKRCDLIVIPTGTSLDDLVPQRILAEQLTGKAYKLPKEKILFVINKVLTNLDSPNIEAAREYLSEPGFRVAQQAIPMRPAYESAQDQGKSISEVTFPSLNGYAANVLSEIGEIVMQLAEAA